MNRDALETFALARSHGEPARTALAALGAEPTHWSFCTNDSGTAALGIPTIGFGPGDETLAAALTDA